MCLNIKDIFPSVNWEFDYNNDINNFRTKIRSKGGYLLKLNSSCLKNLYEDFKETMQDSSDVWIHKLFETPCDTYEELRNHNVLAFETDFNFFDGREVTRIYKIVKACNLEDNKSSKY